MEHVTPLFKQSSLSGEELALIVNEASLISKARTKFEERKLALEARAKDTSTLMMKLSELEGNMMGQFRLLRQEQAKLGQEQAKLGQRLAKLENQIQGGFRLVNQTLEQLNALASKKDDTKTDT